MLPFTFDAEDVEWIKAEVQRIRLDTERAYRERDWVITALNTRMSSCPCGEGGCEQCIANGRLIGQILTSPGRPPPRPRSPCRECGDTHPVGDSEFCRYCLDEGAHHVGGR